LLAHHGRHDFKLNQLNPAHLFTETLQVPLDGDIVYGEAQVSMQHITGEAMPTRQAAGSSVPAGSQNHDGVLVVRATCLSDDSTPARISKMAADAQVKAMSIQILRSWWYRLCNVYAGFLDARPHLQDGRSRPGANPWSLGMTTPILLCPLLAILGVESSATTSARISMMPQQATELLALQPKGSSPARASVTVAPQPFYPACANSSRSHLPRVS